MSRGTPRQPDQTTPRGLDWLAVALAALAFAVVALAPARSAAVDDLSIEYETLKTPHFHVHYDSEHEGLARRVGRIAEEAHGLLVPLLDFQPDNRTHVVVDDKVDTANGSASIIGRKVIRIFAMPPEPHTSLGYYDDWLRILIFHEYVHILHLDTDGGLVAFLNDIFGGIVHPNGLLPRWYIEGLAVHYESAMTGTGRTNSSMFRTWLRTAVLEDRFFSLAEASNSPQSWPFGTTPYLYGGFFLEYIADKYGLEAPTDFNHRYGRRIIPFAINHTFETITDVSFHELWNEWEAHLKGRALATHVAVEARGRTDLSYITSNGGRHLFTRARPGTHQMSFFESGLNSKDRFSITFTHDERTSTLFETEGANGVASWTPDGEALVFGRLTVQENVYTYNDLYIWNAERDRTERLTHGERAHDPAISPDGERIAYVRNKPGTNNLVLCDFGRLRVDDCRRLVGGDNHRPDNQKRWQQISTPTWTPDGEAVVFSRWRADIGHRDLWMYRLEADDGEHLERLTDDAAHDTAPHVGLDGLLYWSTDRTGIFNIYARDLETGETWQVSNVETGLFQPRVSADGYWLYASAYTADGYELVRYPRPTRFQRDAPDSYAQRPHPSYPEIDSEEWETGGYNALRWLHPLLFRPSAGVASGGGGLGGTVIGREPLGHHDWALSATLLTPTDFGGLRGNFGLNYNWTGGPVNVSTSLTLQEPTRLRSKFAGDQFVPFVERQYAADLGLTYPLRRVQDRLALTGGFRAEFRTFRDEPVVDHDPLDRQPADPDHGWYNRLRLGLRYSDLERYPDSISIARGLSAQTTVSFQDEALGSRTSSTYLTYGLRGYLPNPWLRRHILHLRLDGGIARAEGRNPAFALGGFQSSDVLNDMIFQQPQGQFVLRGYPPRSLVGSQFQVWTGAYRFPIVRFGEGPSTAPVYVERLKGSLFSDAGGAFNGLLADADLRASVGAELQLELQFGWYLGGALRAGFARGLGEGGINEWYILYGNGF
jgi:hypothetical protein